VGAGPAAADASPTLVADLIFGDHARRRMRERHISADEVYHVMEDADDVIVRDDGSAIYVRVIDQREIVVVIESDGRSVGSVWDWKRRRLRRR
jgi:hypothetical protein